MNRRLFLSLLVLPGLVNAQITGEKEALPFSEQAVSYVPSSKTSLHYNWADFDSDNDLDMLVTSNELKTSLYFLEDQQYTSVFYNKGTGSFSKAFSINDSVSMGSSAVGDYDNDGDLDFVLSGARNIIYMFPLVYGFPYTRIYQNNSTSFDTIHANIINLCRSAVEFQDLDNDGDLDIIICGDKTFTSFVFQPASVVYRNDGSGAFEKMNVELKAVAGGRITCFDYDGNGYSDILLTGIDQNQEVFCALYKNNGNYSFSPVILPLDSIRVNYNTWLDYNKDGKFDFIAGGKLFKNEGSDVFTPSSTWLRCSGFGDFNNDGFSDLINDNKICVNEMGQHFDVNYPLKDQHYACADINNDGKIDVIGKSYHYANNTATANTKPTVPGNLRSSLAEGKVVFKWDPANDNENGPEGITYNVCIGNSTNPQQYFSPGSNPSTGYHKTMKYGNTGSNDSIAIGRIGSSLLWKVQAIDNNLLASQFSEAKSFTFPLVFDNAKSAQWKLQFLWGDFTKDGKMDYLYKSTYYSGPEGYALEKNLGNMNFQIIPSGITLTKNTGWRWCDFDNDNDIDLIGLDSNIIGVNIDPNTFNFVNNPFPVGSWGKLSVCKDMDNDGDYDYIISSVSDTRIYFKESGGGFTSYMLENTACDSVISFDFDNDSDNDIFIKDTKSRFVNTGYRNFTRTQPDIVPFGMTYDFDNDGDIDVFNNSILYINQDQVFLTEKTDVRKLSGKFMHRAGDFDNDGDFDIILGGNLENKDYLGLYVNNGSGKFTEDETFSDITVFTASSVSNFADFDNDNDLDFVHEFKELDMGYQLSRYKRNNFNKPNSRAEAPANLTSFKTGHGIELSWTAPNDKESGTGLSYNLRIGTTPKATDIMSPASDLNEGNLYIPEPGQLSQPFWRSDSLPLGKYYWSVQAVDHGFAGGTWADEEVITIENLRADFTADTVCPGSATTFTDKSVIYSGTISQWKWDFGDGTSSSLRNPTHPYANGGMYHVTLKVTSGEDADSITREVTVRYKPIAAFTADIACHTRKTSFTDQSDISHIEVASWRWDFMDGNISAVQGNIQHTYLLPGNYRAKLEITATNGCRDTISKNVTVAGIPNSTIGLYSGYPAFCEGKDSCILEVQDNEKYSYQWKIDDFNISGATTHRLIIKKSGNYSVEIVNTIGNCSVESEKKTITAYATPDPPAIIASVLPALVCSGDSIRLEATYHSNYTYQWRLNEGTTGLDTNVYYAAAEGNYTLEVSVGDGCTSLPSAPLFVDIIPSPEKPVIDKSGPTGFCEGDSVILSIPLTAGCTYRWGNEHGFIPGSTGTNYTARESGNYLVEITNQSNCMRTSNAIHVVVYSAPDPPVIVARGAMEFCYGDSVEIYTDHNPAFTYQWKYNEGNIGTNSNKIFARENGNYWLVVEVTGVGECSQARSKSITITTQPNPDKPAISLNRQAAICTGEAVRLSVPSSSTWFAFQWRRNANNITGAVTSTYSATTAGNYSVRITNENGCSAESNPVSVTVSDPPRVDRITVLSDDTIICRGQTVLLSVPYHPDYAYQWYCNWILLPGSTGATLEAAEEGSHTVVVSSNNCSDTTRPQQIRFKPGLPKPELHAYGPNLWYLLCSNDTANYYRWYYNGSQVYNKYTYIYFADQNLGEYQVTISDDNECYVSSGVVSIPPTGEGKVEGGNPVILYPNPGSGTFFIRGLASPGSRYRYTLTDLLGNEVAGGQMKVSDGEALLFDFHFLQAGVYFIGIFNDESKIYSGKLVINY